MPAPKTDAEKALQGTLRNCRMKAARSSEAIERDMRFVAGDHHGKVREVQRLNPAFRIQRDAIRMLLTLRKQSEILKSELKTLNEQAEPEHDDWSGF